jgi:hypothetical protein
VLQYGSELPSKGARREKWAKKLKIRRINFADHALFVRSSAVTYAQAEKQIHQLIQDNRKLISDETAYEINNGNKQRKNGFRPSVNNSFLHDERLMERWTKLTENIRDSGKK